MPMQITEFVFLDQLAGRFHVPAPRYLEGPSSRAAIKRALESWGGRAVIKPDVLAGRRGAGDAVRAVNSAQDAMRELKRCAALEVGGRLARSSYLVEYIPADLEVYTAITYDSRYCGPSFTVSLEGGVEIESVPSDKKRTIPVNVFRGLDAYQASDLLAELGCPAPFVSALSRAFVSLWDMFISSGMRMCEVNPWRVTRERGPVACDFKAIFDEANYKFKNLDLHPPEYPENLSEFDEEMAAFAASSHQGQAHVSDLGGELVLPLTFGGGASTIVTETLTISGGSPMFLSDFGGNPPYERMHETARICFDHRLGQARLLLVLGGIANNTQIDVTFQAIADALVGWAEAHGPPNIPAVVGRGGPGLVQGLLAVQQAFEQLHMPYVIFGPDTPITLVAEYAARLAQAIRAMEEGGHAH